MDLDYERTNKWVENAEGDDADSDMDERSESILSSDFPWAKPAKPQTIYFVPDSESGRDVQAAGFFLFMISSLLLSSGIGLGIVALWAVLHRTRYLDLIQGSHYIGIGSLSLCSALLSMPCSWVSWAMHNKKKVSAYLPLLIVLLSFSLTMLSAGTCFAILQRTRMTSTDFKTGMNETMTGAMKTNENAAWEFVQKTFKCCGTSRPTDWISVNNNSIPSSCCENTRVSVCIIGKAYTVGCLERLMSDLHSELCLVIGLNSVVFCLQIFSLGFVSSLFALERWQSGKR